MKSNLMYYLAGIVLFTAGCGCKRETINPEETITSTNGQNLILNGNFEIDGQATAINWFFAGGIEGDTSTPFSQDTPPLGGNRSLPLHPGWAPQVGFSETYINATGGTDVYELRVWMKSNNGWPGSISIGIGAKSQKLYPDPLTQVKSVSDTVTNWTEYILIDTLTTQANDTIVVRLSAGTSNLSLEADKVFFDLVELTSTLYSNGDSCRYQTINIIDSINVEQCFTFSCFDSTYIINDNTTYQNLLNCNVQISPCDTFTLPSVNFSTQTVLGLKTIARNTPANYERKVFKCVEKKEYKYIVDVYDVGWSDALEQKMNFVIIPKIPAGYNVVFEVNYN